MDSPEVLIGKAATLSTSAVTTWLLLNTEQRREFIDLVHDQSVMMGMGRTEDVIGQLDMANYDIAAGKITGGLAEGTAVAAADQIVPTFGGRSLAPEAFDAQMLIGMQRLLHRNIRGAALQDDLINTMGNYLADGMEDIAINAAVGGTGAAAPAGAAPGYYTTIDGWRQKSMSGHIYDHLNGYINPGLFLGMLGMVPTKWRNPVYMNRMRFFTSIQVVDQYRDYLSRRTTPLGDLSISAENQLAYAGIPIVGVPHIKPSSYPGALAYSGTTDGYGWVLLTMTDNLVTGWGPEIRFFMHPRVDGKIMYLNWWGEMDVQFPIIDAVVTAVNCQPTSDPALLAAY